MWKAQQRQLINQLCMRAGICESLDLILETGTLSCQDIPVTLLPGTNDRSLAIYIQLGHPDPSQITTIYRRLLELNLLITHTQGERFAVDPDSSAVVYGFELANASAEQLWISLQRATTLATEWRSTFFLQDDLMDIAS
jgi:hypothetical protein